MSRRRTIAALTMALVFVGASFVAYVLFTSLEPSSKAEDAAEGTIIVEGLSAGAYIIADVDGTPYFVENVDRHGLRVMKLVPEFSNPDTRGSAIWPTFRSTSSSDGCAFREAARGVCYDINGEVLPGSHPEALAMKEMGWRYVVSERAIELVEREF